MAEAGRVFQSEHVLGSKDHQSTPVSVRASGVVNQTLLLARSPISYEDLVTRLCETSPSANPDKMEKLVSELWKQTFLLNDQRPPLTAESPARYVAKRLKKTG